MDNLKVAKEKMIIDNRSLVVVKNGQIVFESSKKGIVPMYDLYNEGLTGKIYISDRFIGGGAAKFILNFEASTVEVFTNIISKGALNLLESKGIKVEYKKIVDKILNRTGDDFCPVEKISMENDDFNVFYNKLRDFLLQTKQI
ncbi:DUF1893 domain-containing protein [Miniphocaeibacter halophilus]|uniref:DUF1893 domain-containing protein n=1 Tax=Miniphocaeibacter halophilus TaxID=2931922 RepID=A0AC61MPT7_9FIRM|nr:DUF1893 domain-containing protein [Miniphocaeibacter halophilus]QQK07472.1 DUF1893 domain-containing protein [Miniphocaeibacter halophilus]